MPQFDIFIYLTIFIIFFNFSCILYIIISLFVIPFFWNIFYLRYLKKINNKFFEYLFINYKKNLYNKNFKKVNRYISLSISLSKKNKMSKRLIAYKIYFINVIRLFIILK
jgi:hypothetical protein